MGRVERRWGKEWKKGGRINCSWDVKPKKLIHTETYTYLWDSRRAVAARRREENAAHRSLSKALE